MKKIYSVIFYLLALILIIIYVLSSTIFNISLSEFGRLFLLCGSCFFLYLGGLLLSKCTKTNKPMKINLWIFLILYLVLIITLTLFDPMWGRHGLTITKWTKEMLDNYINNSLNLIPFATIKRFISEFNTLYPARTIIYNLLGNFVCMMPLSLLLPLIFKKQNKWYIFLFTITLFVIGIELTQFITLSGCCDIDDLILNVMGAFTFYCVLKIKTLHNLICNIFLLEERKINKKVLGIITGIFCLIICIIYFLIRQANNLYNRNLDIHLSQYHYDLEIVDKETSCNSNFEMFYEDELFNYYFDCDKSDKVYAIINGDEKYLVKELLSNSPTTYKISIDKLGKAGLKFTKVNKYQYITIEFDQIVNFDITNENEEILMLKTDGIYYDHNSTNYTLYLIPKLKGKTIISIKVQDAYTDKYIGIKRYSVVIDDNLNVTYDEV